MFGFFIQKFQEKIILQIKLLADKQILVDSSMLLDLLLLPNIIMLCCQSLNENLNRLDA